MLFRKIKKEDFEDWLNMGLLLWPHHSKSYLKKEFKKLLRSRKIAVFLCENNNYYIGFVIMALRYEYVGGTKSSPVGYVEGIFVRKEYRKKGIAKKLIKMGEKWAKDRGCKEVASDTKITNEVSKLFHIRLGFKQVNTLVHFVKSI